MIIENKFLNLAMLESLVLCAVDMKYPPLIHPLYRTEILVETSCN